MKGLIFDIQRFSLHDGPGIRTTVFFKGCSLRCSWCQNPEGIQPRPELMFTQAFCVNCGACVKACPHGVHRMENGVHVMDRSGCVVCGKCATACLSQALAVAGQEMTVADVMRVVREDRVYYETSGGGVTLSGGEPLMQADFAAKLLAACKKDGFHTAVDTALDVDWKAVEKVLPHTDLFLADIKHADAAQHERGTGRRNERVLANLRELNRRGAAIVVRVPLIPGFNDSESALAAIAGLAASLERVQFVELLPFHKLGEPKSEALGKISATRDTAVLVREVLERLAKAAEAKGVRVKRRWGRTGKEHGAEGMAHGDGSGRWRERLEAIHALKLKHTAEKQKRGPRDLDDWGDIPLREPFAFMPETAHPKGYVLGPRDCGRNFARFLEGCPTYVDRNSSLLGGYYVTFGQYVTGWDPDNYWSDLAPAFKKYGIIHGIDNNQHFLSDVRIGLDLGWSGLLAKISKYRTVNKGEESQAYYDGLESYVRGIQSWIRNHAAAARQMASAEQDPLFRRNLEEMAGMNERLVEQPPRTFREACQWLAWYQMAKRMYNGGGPMGRLDRILWPYYERDLAAGRMDEEEAIFHLACFLVKDSHYIQLGGMDEQGNDQTNRLSFLFLEAAHRVQVPANIAVAVHEKTDPALMRRATELLFVDKMGIPRFAGMKGIVEGMVRRGFPLEVARQRVQAGCHWFCIPGREYCFNDVIKINFARILEVALDEVIADCGSRIADCEEKKRRSPSVARVWAAFRKHLRRAVEVTAKGIDFHVEHQHRYYPEFGLSLLCHGPVEKGVDASHGAVEYVNVGVDGAALATVADSFAAIEQRVEREGSVTWSELSCALNQKWWRCGRIRMLLQSVPGFGRGGSRGDWWAERISKAFSEAVVEKRTPAGHWMTPGLFSWASTISMGRETGATPDGRGAGDPISFGANPNPGRLHGGALVPTGMSTAIARVQSGYGNPAPLQFDVDPGLVSDDEGIEKFDAFIRAHFQLGGTLINANILDREKVLDACRNPSKYPDLVVRVTGFSVYFASLSDAFRKLVYERVVAMEGAS